MPIPISQRASRLIVVGLVVAAIAFVDWRVEVNLAFGFLYLFPILLIGTVATRWQIVLAATVCTFLADLLDPVPFRISFSLPQDILIFSALTGTGLYSHEVTRRRDLERKNIETLEVEVAARRLAEQQLEFLIESSPAAIFTMSADHRILHANSAAHRLLGVAPEELSGRSVRRYIPALCRVPSMSESPQVFRTEMQCHGERENGEVFLANVFFSTYATTAGARIAAFVVDASEQMREREELSLEQLMAGSRILVGAVFHEVRNVCSAISVIYENLVRSRVLDGNKDFEPLGSLVRTLNNVASLELKQSAADSHVGTIDLGVALDDLRIVLEPYCREADINLHWEIPSHLPLVCADRHKLLQVLLNLTKNSERAFEGTEGREVYFSISVAKAVVSIRVTDTGSGIRFPSKLFQPFQDGAESTGLGLFLSRAFIRSFGGDLRYDPASTPGCSFVIDLAVADSIEQDLGSGIKDGANATSAG